MLEETIDENYEPTEEEIKEYAKWLGMDLEADKHLFWVAREGLKAPLPSEWKPCQSPDGELYYFNFSSGESVWDHPCDDHYRNMYKVRALRRVPCRSSRSEEKPALAPLARATAVSTRRCRPFADLCTPGGAGGEGEEPAPGAREEENLQEAAEALGRQRDAAECGGRAEGQVQPQRRERSARPGQHAVRRNAPRPGACHCLRPVAHGNAVIRRGGGAKKVGGTPGGLPGLSGGIPLDNQRGMLGATPVASAAPQAAATAAAGSSSAGAVNEAALEKEFKEWEAAQKKQHEDAKAALLKRIAEKTNDDQLRQARKQASDEVTEVRKAVDKLRLEKDEIETRSPVVRPGTGQQDELERARTEMAVQKEETQLQGQLTAAEYEERTKMMEEEKSAIENAVAQAEAELQQELNAVQGEHDKAVEEAKSGYERAKQRAEDASAQVGQLAQQKESTLLLQETERYSTELRQKLQAATAEAEAEMEAKLEEAKAEHDKVADEKVKEERTKLDATREKELAEVRDEMETKKTKLLREVTDQVAASASAGGDDKEVVEAELSKAREAFAAKAKAAKSSLESKLDTARTEARQGLPAAELKLKTELSDELDEMEKDFKAQLEKEKQGTSGDGAADAAEEDEVTTLPPAKEAELRAWKEEHERASAEGIAAEVAELETRNRAEMAKAGQSGDQEERVEAKRASLAAELEAETKRLAESAARALSASTTVAQEANARETRRLRLQLQTEADERTSKLSAELRTESAKAGAALEKERARVEAELAKTRTERQTSLERATAALAELEAAAAAEESRLSTEQQAQDALKLQLDAQAAGGVAAAPTGLQAQALAEAEAALSSTQAKNSAELSARREQYAQEEAALRAELGRSETNTSGEAERLQQDSERRTQYAAQLAAGVESARAAERSAAQAAEASMAAEFTALEQRLQAAMTTGQRDGGAAPEVREAQEAASTVSRELAATEEEERTLKARIESDKQQLAQAQAQVAQLEKQAAADADAKPKQAWGEETEASTSQRRSAPLGDTDGNRQQATQRAAKQPPAATWAEPVAQDVPPADQEADAEAEPVEPAAQDQGGWQSGGASRFEAERLKLQRAKAAASSGKTRLARPFLLPLPL